MNSNRSCCQPLCVCQKFAGLSCIYSRRHLTITQVILTTTRVYASLSWDASSFHCYSTLTIIVILIIASICLIRAPNSPFTPENCVFALLPAQNELKWKLFHSCSTLSLPWHCFHDFNRSTSQTFLNIYISPCSLSIQALSLLFFYLHSTNQWRKWAVLFRRICAACGS